MSLLDTTKFMEVVSNIYEKRLTRACNDPKIANDQLEDNNEIMAQIWIQTIFKTFRLVIIIFLISYYLGMLFYVFSDIMNDIPPFPGDTHEMENFMTYNSMDAYSSKEKTIIMIYFSMTSLSTVGFGDFNPRSDLERLFIAGLLLIGVSVFSYIMGNLIEIIDEIGTINATFNDGDNLAKFFGLIKRFNHDKAINHEIV
jgi:hypothetical protein